jgi:hypothetical protein
VHSSPPHKSSFFLLGPILLLFMPVTVKLLNRILLRL